MAEKKMTKKNWFEEIIAVVEVSETIAEERKTEMLNFLNHEIELLNKKATSASTSKVKEEQKAVMADIYQALSSIDKPVTVSELQKEIPSMAEYSNQKISAMLRKLVENGEVVRTIEKKKAYFSIPSEE